MFHTRRKLEGRIAVLEQQNGAFGDKVARLAAERLMLRAELRRITDERDGLIAKLVAVRAILDPAPADPTPAE